MKGLNPEYKTISPHPFCFFKGSIFTRNTWTKKLRAKKISSKKVNVPTIKTCVEDASVTKGKDKSLGGTISTINKKYKKNALKNHAKEKPEKYLTSHPA